LDFLPCDTSPFLVSTSFLTRVLDHKFISQQNERETLSSTEGIALAQLPWLCLSMSEISVDPGKWASFFPCCLGSDKDLTERSVLIQVQEWPKVAMKVLGSGTCSSGLHTVSFVLV